MKLKRGILIALILAAIVFVIMFGGEFLELVHDYSLKFTDIPKLYLTGDISAMEDKKDVRVIPFSYDDGEDTVSGYVEMKIQGSSSIYYHKKNYTMKFFKDEALEEPMMLDVGWVPRMSIA